MNKTGLPTFQLEPDDEKEEVKENDNPELNIADTIFEMAAKKEEIQRSESPLISKPKKERTEKQIAAFEKARVTRAKNLATKKAQSDTVVQKPIENKIDLPKPVEKPVEKPVPVEKEKPQAVSVKSDYEIFLANMGKYFIHMQEVKNNIAVKQPMPQQSKPQPQVKPQVRPQPAKPQPVKPQQVKPVKSYLSFFN